MEYDEELTDIVKEEATDLGADKVGVADAERADGTRMFFASPYSFLKDAKSILSLCLSYPKGAFGYSGEDFYVIVSSFGNTRKLLNDRLNELALSLAAFLEEKGYKAVPLPSVLPVDERRWTSCMVSNRYIGQLAGLGGIGRNNFLLTPEWGPRVELTSVITNAPMRPDGPKLAEKIYRENCEDCFKCVEACRSQALDRKKEPPYNFDLNKCLWGIQGWRHLSGVDVPPQDWRDAKPTPSRVIPKYKKKYPKIEEYWRWQNKMGRFPYCIACRTICPVGKE